MNDTPEDNMSWGRTAQLALREFGPQDAEALAAMHRDPRVREQLIDDIPLDQPELARLFLEQLALVYRRHEGLGVWHVTLTQPQPRFAGAVNLMPMCGLPGEIEIGARLLPFAWGRGVPREAGRLLLDHAFGRLRRERVWGLCHPVNRGAQLGLAALGFESLGNRPYGGVMASWWRVDAQAWLRHRDLPRSARMRQALEAVR